jgi:hypothetical protein
MIVVTDQRTVSLSEAFSRQAMPFPQAWGPTFRPAEREGDRHNRRIHSLRTRRGEGRFLLLSLRGWLVPRLRGGADWACRDGGAD